MTKIYCENCGSDRLEERGDIYYCPHCHTVWRKHEVDEVYDKLASILDEQKQERVANLRRQLYDELCKKYTDSYRVVDICRELKGYLPEDFRANFFETANGNSTRAIAEAIGEIDVAKEAQAVPQIIDFLIKSLQPELLLAVNGLIERAYKQNDLAEYSAYATRFAEEAKKVDESVYDVTQPRDVFVAYSSADMAKVEELVSVLEEEGLSCFVAMRNLQHGRGAVARYDELLQQAIDNCRAVVLVSSHKARTASDARSKELTYIKRKDVEAAPAQYKNDYVRMPAQFKKPRVEYLIEPYRNVAMETFVKQFFNGFEFRYNPKDVAESLFEQFDNARIEEQPIEKPADVKYCAACGAECAQDAKFCSECGGREFVPTHEDYIEAKAKREKDDEIARAKREKDDEIAKIKAQYQAQIEALQQAQRVAEKARKAKEEAERNAPQLYDLGEKYNKGNGVEKDATKAAQYFMQAAELGHKDAQYSLGCCYYDGTGVVRDDVKAVYWFQKSADQGHATAQDNLGVCYYYGRGVAKDLSKAVYWYQKAAEQGQAQAQYNLAYCYRKGEGVARDDVKALYWCQKAADQGHEVAKTWLPTYKAELSKSDSTSAKSSQNSQQLYDLGEKYYYGKGVPKDTTKAAQYFMQAAELGHKDAQCYLGYCYQYGIGVAKDISKAVSWYQKSANQGSGAAQFDLGHCYQYGDGVSQDYSKAVYWFQKSADQGYANAQCSLGNCYYNGNSVPRDYSKAVFWYQKAVDQGNAAAQYNLGICYKNGRGVTKDLNKAVYWMQKAADQGHEDAKKWLPTFKEELAKGPSTSSVSTNKAKTLFTRCPKCHCEISFTSPPNVESLPETYRHMIKCPQCGTTIKVKLNNVKRK